MNERGADYEEGFNVAKMQQVWQAHLLVNPYQHKWHFQ